MECLCYEIVCFLQFIGFFFFFFLLNSPFDSVFKQLRNYVGILPILFFSFSAVLLLFNFISVFIIYSVLFFFNFLFVAQYKVCCSVGHILPTHPKFPSTHSLTHSYRIRSLTRIFKEEKNSANRACSVCDWAHVRVIRFSKSLDHTTYQWKSIYVFFSSFAWLKKTIPFSLVSNYLVFLFLSSTFLDII